MNETIFAAATAPGRAAVAVVRLSGRATSAAVETLTGGLPAPRRASLRRLRDPADGAILDEALVLWFPGPGSYTGEDSAEFHVHGGPAVVDGVLGVLQRLGLRLAEAGEFTRRAFEAGKLDLAQAEGVADLVDAETAAQARQALAQLGGALSGRYDAWREKLIHSLAMLEAAVDFPDEDLPEAVAMRARPGLEALRHEIGLALADTQRGRRVREGYRIALIGAPNAGKSSLLNALAGRQAAIVTEIAGTTRDVIEAPLVLAGYRVILSDTAGLRETQDVVELEGVRRARAAASEADLRLGVVDIGASGDDWREAVEALRPGDFLILNKQDLPPVFHVKQAALPDGAVVLPLAARDGNGLAALEAALVDRVVADLSGAEAPAATRMRHDESLREAASHLDRALADLSEPELAAENVRLAARALARVTGRVDHEDVLARVFSSFCIGK